MYAYVCMALKNGCIYTDDAPPNKGTWFFPKNIVISRMYGSTLYAVTDAGMRGDQSNSAVGD